MERLTSYDSVTELKIFLKRNGFAMSKRFGQNFLVSPGGRSNILSLLDPGKEESVWEIGPGLGALTHELINQVKMLTVFEIDHGFVRYLHEVFGNNPRFALVDGDVVKTWRQLDPPVLRPDKIVGNLPYSSASAIISSFIEHDFIPERMVFTVQKEMGERMTARPGSKNYSSFSMLCQFKCTIADGGTLNPGAFYPVPDVVSNIIVMEPHHKFSGIDGPLFVSFIHDLFLSRRKKIRNNVKRGKLSRTFSREQILYALESAGIDPDDRGERIDTERAVNAVRLLQKTSDLSG